MQSVHKVLVELRRRMTQALPNRVVADDYVDFAQRRRDELLKGVISVLLTDVKPQSEWTCMADVTVVAQIEVQTRDGHPSDGELAEQILAGEIRAFLRNPSGAIPHVEVLSIGYSAQREHPYHWCAFRCGVGLIDESGDGLQDGQLYPLWVDPQVLAGVDVKIDMDPHETRAQHDAWLAGDETPNPPDLKLTVELNK